MLFTPLKRRTKHLLSLMPAEMTNLTTRFFFVFLYIFLYFTIFSYIFSYIYWIIFDYKVPFFVFLQLSHYIYNIGLYLTTRFFSLQLSHYILDYIWLQGSFFHFHYILHYIWLQGSFFRFPTIESLYIG